MKKITLVQYIEVCRTVTIQVQDDATEQEAAEKLNNMPLRQEDLPNDVTVVNDWSYICDGDIENTNGKVILTGEN